MSYFLIIRGPLGSGKTTISHKLSGILHAKHFLMDDVLASHGLDIIPPNAPCIPAEQFIKANAMVLPEIRLLLQQGTIVIVDACFYHRDVIEHLVQQLPFEHYIFTLKAPLELCIQRDAVRGKSHGADAAGAVHSLVSQFDYGMSIDVSGTLDDAIQAILSQLPKAPEEISR